MKTTIKLRGNMRSLLVLIAIGLLVTSCSPHDSSELKSYKDELLNAQIVCNSVIPQKFPQLENYNYTKQILLGYKDSTLGQFGYRGSRQKEESFLPDNVKFRWTWSLNNGSFIKCLIYSNKYEITLERL